MRENCWASLIRATTDDVKRLTAVVRYSSIPVAVHETVAEHSFWVSLYAAMIARALGADHDVQGQVALFGTTHDLAECVTGDVVRPFKYSSRKFKEEVDAAESLMVRKLPPEVGSLMSDMDTLRGHIDIRFEYIRAIVKAADWLSVFQYMRREAARGNLEIIPFYMRMVKDLGSAMEENYGREIPVPGTSAPFRPEPFYHALHNEAFHVANDCFGALAEPGSRWMRDV